MDLPIVEEFVARLHSKEAMDDAVNRRKNTQFKIFVVRARSLFDERVLPDDRIEILIAAFLSTYPLTSSASLELYQRTQCPHARDVILRCTALARSTVSHECAETTLCIDEETSGFFV